MTTQTVEAQPTATVRAGSTQLTKSTRRVISLTVAYTVLTLGAIFFIFPMFWMVTASLKPEWQILTEPISIPSEWIHVQAGDTTQEIPTWYATDPSGERDQVIKIGTRRYTTVIDASRLTDLISVPSAELSDAQPMEVQGIMFNVRTWTADDGSVQQVVALARDGDNLVVAPVDSLVGAASRMALADVNAGSRARIDIGDYTFQARELETPSLTVIPIGPETELTIVAPSAIAEQAILVPSETLGDPEYVSIGNTELQHYTLSNHAADEYYIVLSAEVWQPVIELEAIRDFGFAVDNERLAGEREVREFALAPMPVDRLTREDGSQVEVVLLIETAQRSLVIPAEHAGTIRLSPLSKLAEPFVVSIENMAVRYRDDYEEHDERHSVAIVGDRVDMTLVVPESAISEAFDVPSDSLERVQRVRLHIENYVDMLSRDLGGATFLRFFGNSALLVLLNVVGHFLSVTLAAYGFARLRAPGKRVLFLVLLSTMMLPWPVMLIPQYEIFQNLNMINSLWPLFIRAFFGNAFLIFLLRQFFMSIPQELEDAARIDGASTLQVLWHVMLPLSKPALATIGIFTFWWTWNSFLEPYVYLSSVKNFTVSLGLGFFKSQYAYNFRLLMAASVVAILPIITIFFFAQRYFIEGIQLTGLKG